MTSVHTVVTVSRRSAFHAISEIVQRRYALDDLIDVTEAMSFLCERMRAVGHAGTARLEYCAAPRRGQLTIALATSTSIRIVFA